MLDLGLLIECIQERTFLWDEKNKHYKDIKARDSAWLEIGEEMFSNWSELSREEKADKTKEMKTKWRHLRDNLLRSVRKESCDYMYADSLYFLLEAFKKRKAEKAQNNEAHDNSSSDSFQNTNGLRNVQPNLSQGTSDCSSSDSIKNTSRLRKILPSLSQGISDCSSSDSIQNIHGLRNIQPVLSQEIRKNVQASPVEDKAADSFFISLLRDYRELKEDEKLDFRIMCLQYIRDARKKKKFQKQNSVVCSSQQWNSDPMQITPD